MSEKFPSQSSEEHDSTKQTPEMLNTATFEHFRSLGMVPKDFSLEQYQNIAKKTQLFKELLHLLQPPSDRENIDIDISPDYTDVLVTLKDLGYIQNDTLIQYLDLLEFFCFVYNRTKEDLEREGKVIDADKITEIRDSSSKNYEGKDITLMTQEIARAVRLFEMMCNTQLQNLTKEE